MKPEDILREEDRARRAAEGVDPRELLELGRSILDGLQRGGNELRPGAWAWLDLVRRGPHPARLVAAHGPGEPFELILGLIDASGYTLARMLEQRVAAYGPRALFVRPSRKGLAPVSWLETTARIDAFARALLATADETTPGPVGFLSENRLDSALLDLACLTTGVPAIMVPANLGDAQAGDVFARTAPGLIVVSGPELAQRIERLRPSLPSVHTVVDVDDERPTAPGFIGIPELLARGTGVAPGRLAAARADVRLDRTATLMFTSGTTGRPKGIRFSLRNLVSKRFARGLALPEIGERDVFLCYLPLFHTFGRYLELLGTIYWGATYGLLNNPSLESLLDGFAQVRPTVFISIPLRWMQLHEEITRRIDIDRATEDERRTALRAVVGERLRWGLSAAGYLSPDVFRFFQRYGVELLSGFGMTEGTGGITMTPPGQYRDESLGVPLPGIDVRLDPDGEMLIRGPYVMQGYDSETDDGLDPDGWLRTGDLFERDSFGHYRLVDRKKEIYKNTKGQTIAPQRVENLFRDIAAVRRVFLVGDHREYNTVLIAPDPDFAAKHLATLSAEERRDAFRSIVASVNRFLSPYERIVDFAIVDRDFTEELGELTPKKTFRRPQVVENFADVIAPMYHRTRLKIAEDGPGLIFPNWLFQALALTASDVRVQDGRLEILPTGARLAVEVRPLSGGAWRVRLGAMLYAVEAGAIDLGLVISCPALWLGNDELVDLVPLEPSRRVRRQRCPPEIRLLGRALPYVGRDEDLARLEEATAAGRIGLPLLDLAARAVGSADARRAFAGLALVEAALTGHTDLDPELGRHVLRAASRAPSTLTRREALRRLWPRERDEVARPVLEQFLAAGAAESDRELLDDATALALATGDISETKLEALIGVTTSAAADPAAPGAPHLHGLVTLLGRHGGDHPSRYRRVRWALAYVEAHAAEPTVRWAARGARETMRRAFRLWLGQPQTLAVDPDTRTEYRWEDTLVFAPEVGAGERERLLRAVRDTALLREAVFLLSGGATVRLNDVPARGITITLAGSYHGRTLYRAVVETRYFGTFELALLLNRSLPTAEIEEELLWLLVAGEVREGEQPVPEVGGYWPELDVWTEEWVPGPSAGEVVDRLLAEGGDHARSRLEYLWSFLVWSAAEAYVEFWSRTGRRQVVLRPSPQRVVVPMHDYQIGPRLMSISPRGAYTGPVQLLDLLHTRLVDPLVARDPALARQPPTYLVCSALLEVLGVEPGLALIERAAAEGAERADALRRYVADVRARGFVPRRLYFAIERFRRWLALAPDATREAQAFTIRQLKESYQLVHVYEQYPESRARFFRETVLRGAQGALGAGLDGLIDALRRREFPPEDLTVRLDAMREHAEPGSNEEYFLVRLSWPHIRPGDAAGFISHERGGVRQNEVVVAFDDARGRPFQVRRPLSPREVGDLHRLFLAAHLQVSFRPDHQFLVALEPTGRPIGGLFYEVEPSARHAHFEKIVVAEAYRQLGVSQALMNEFLHRMQAAGISTVTTGFFRPEYFAHFGFKIDRAYGGQVRLLQPTDL